MGSRQRRGGAEKGKDGADRKMIETIQEATGATEDDIRVMLEECNFDANETTSRLIDNPFSQVQSRKDKKKKRDEDRKKEPASKIMEIRRNSSSGGRGRGHDRERGSRGDRGPDRSSDRGSRHPQSIPASSLPPLSTEKQPQPLPEEESTSGWDLEPQTDRPNPSAGGWGEIGSKPSSQPQQPIGKATAPGPIRPPSAQNAPRKSMADLFKPKPAVEPESSQTAPSNLSTAASSSYPNGQAHEPQLYSAPQESTSEANGWGHTHGSDAQDSSRQGGSLGGVAIGAPKKAASLQQQPIQAGGSTSGGGGSLFPNQTPVGQPPVGSHSNIPSSPQRSKLDSTPSANAWGVPATPSSTGLGGVPVEAPPRQQHATTEQPQLTQFNSSEQQQQPATAWAPKTSASAGTQSLGGSILNSIPQQSFSSATSAVSDAMPSSSPRAPQQSLLGNSHSNFGQSPMVIPSPNQQTSKDLNSATIQFGGFSLGNSSQDLGGFATPAFPSNFDQAASSQAELPATLGPSTSEPFKPSYSHIPPTSLPQSQQQRAYNAFSSAGQPQTQSLVSAQRSNSQGYTPEVSSAATSSHPLYGQGYQNYGTTGQSFNQYQPSTHQQAYQNYSSYQAPAEADLKPSGSAGSQTLSQIAPTAAAKTSNPYDPSQSSYPQYPSHHTAAAGAVAKDYPTPATKYGNASHVPATGQATTHNLAQVVNQTPLTVPAGYGTGQASSLQQGYGGYAGQQSYGNNYQQYNNYVGSGYGGYNQRTANPYQAPSTAYGQGVKGYAGGNYAAGSAGGYQHGAYGAGAHKSEKDHLASHMGAQHNLYGQQQLPLSSQSHFQGGLPSNNQGYGGYSNANQGYSNYGMGGNRQYTNQY